MSKLIGPEGNLEFHSGTDKYVTGKISSRQEGSLLPGVSDELLGEYFRSIQPNQRYKEFTGLRRQLSGILVPQFIESEGPSASDLAKYGWDADESLHVSTRWSDLVKSASQSRVLRAAASLGAIFVGINHFLENSHSAEATEDSQVRLSSVNEGETIRIGDVGITLLHGKMEMDKRIGVAIMRQKGATLDLATRVAQEYFFLSKPLDEFKDKFYIADINFAGGMPDFDCNVLTAECSNWQLENQMIDKVSQATGGGFQETVVLMTGGANGKGAGDGGYPRSSLYTSAYVSLPDNPGPGQKSTLDHEVGRSFFGFQTNEEPCSVMNTAESRCPDFGVKQSETIRRVLSGNPTLRYVTPPLGLEVVPTSQVFSQGEGRLLSDMDTALFMTTPLGTTEIKWWIHPAPNIYTGKPDGPAIEMKYGDPILIHGVSEAGQRIPAPIVGVSDQILLPDMTYTAGLCFQGSNTPLEWGSSRWGEIETISGQKVYVPCEERTFRTLKRNASTIGYETLAGGQTTNNKTPLLKWNNTKTDVFYYEIQVSKDQTFNKDPKIAPTAFIYEELIHGGMTNPLNSYKIPDQYPLEAGATYYWRVKPRIQGDGTPVEWPQPGSFKTSVDARLLSEGDLEIITQPQTRNIVSKEAPFTEQLTPAAF